MSARKARVLIVDDKLEMAEMLADGLRDSDYETRAMSSSREAAVLLETDPFDALVTDLRMPEVDGLGLLAVSETPRPAPAGHRDDGVRRHRLGHRVDSPRRVPLPDEALQTRRARHLSRARVGRPGRAR